MSLKRKHQLFMVEESTEATVTTLFTAGNGSYLPIEPTIEFEAPRFERQINRDSLTALQGLSGIQTGTCRFGLELTGTSAFGTVPQFGLPLRACGFRQEIVRKLTIGAVTNGPFRHGEQVSQATSLATGMVVADTYTGQTTLWIAQGNGLGTGTFNGTDIITGASSGATATASAFTANGGYGWWPQSLALTQITLGNALDNSIADGDTLQGATSLSLWQAVGAYTTSATVLYLRRISGHFSASEALLNLSQSNTANASTTIAEVQFQIPSLTMGLAKDGVRESIKFSRGTFTMSGAIGEPMIINFEFKGGYSAVADQGNVGGVTFAQTVPPVLLDADLGLGRATAPGLTFALEHVPCIRAIELAMGNEVNFNECMANATGIDNTLITARKPTGSFDPDLIAEALFPWIGDFLSNTSFRARFSVGSVLGNKFLMTMPALSTVSSGTGDRNGISTRQIGFELTGGSQTISALNVENELVIVAPYA